ncbi:hypothetical protein [Nesterenkonia sandarakina]|uniref:Uncharacterized protein n=1 Tax=Nesterenkonia sandarakina TaxID=272918 RepID=A0A2T0YRE5_9MICC|nr:hypothetical protein [Nesterenkonia sandarakina]PRZ18142.1 hypothetical protein BCL67_103128 [Nesterenkonia sandarakina]
MVLIPSVNNPWPGGGGGDAPELRPGLEEADITPGIEGFLFTALVVVLLIVVVRDLVKRMRRMKYRAQVEAEYGEDEAEFPGEITESEISAAQQRSRDAAAEARFGPAPTTPAPPAENEPHPPSR